MSDNTIQHRRTEITIRKSTITKRVVGNRTSAIIKAVIGVCRADMAFGNPLSEAFRNCYRKSTTGKPSRIVLGTWVIENEIGVRVYSATQAGS